MNNDKRFDDIDYGRVESYRVRTVSLDNATSALTPLEIPLAGTFVYIDDDSDGKVYIRLNDKNDYAFPAESGFSFSNLKYRRMYLHWGAQPGKKVNIVYGFDAAFAPTNALALSTMPADFYRRSINGNHFLGTGAKTTVPGDYPYFGLYNPGGSGKRLALLSALLAGPYAAGTVVEMRRYNGGSGAVVGTGYNKNIFEAESLAEMQAYSSAIILGDLMDWVTTQAVDEELQFIKRDTAPLIIGEGETVLFRPLLVGGTTIRGRLDWEEF